MINITFVQKLKTDYKKHESERRQIISLSNVVLHDSKRVIFSLHREDKEIAKASLMEIESVLKKLDKQFGQGRLSEEGSYKACVEEYVEAKLFYAVMDGKKIDKIKEVKLSADSYLGGICDLAGEIVRWAINQASSGNFGEVQKAKETINEIMAQLVDFDMTGYLRTKYDQARNHLRKIEQVAYEVKIRGKN